MVCRYKRLLSALALSLGFCHASALFAQSTTDLQQAPPSADISEFGGEAAPSIEFLDFLGQWEADDGEWIAPEDLADEEFARLIDTALDTGLEESD